MNFSLVSDIHVDIPSTLDDFILPGGETLLLAGDMAEVGSINPRFRIERLSKEEEWKIPYLVEDADALRKKILVQLNKYNRVYSVLGNHEHYRSDLDRTATLYREALPEVTLLDNTWVSMGEDVVLFGSTLWSDMDKEDPLSMLRSKDWSDYTRIYVNKGSTQGYRRLRVADTLAAHKKALKALYECLDVNKDKRVIVMTHFSPTYMACDEKYKLSLENPYFHSELSDIILSNTNIVAWCFGHTHTSWDFMIGGCRLMCNPRGYVAYGEQTGFRPDFNFTEGFESPGL